MSHKTTSTKKSCWDSLNTWRSKTWDWHQYASSKDSTFSSRTRALKNSSRTVTSWKTSSKKRNFTWRTICTNLRRLITVSMSWLSWGTMWLSYRNGWWRFMAKRGPLLSSCLGRPVGSGRVSLARLLGSGKKPRFLKASSRWVLSLWSMTTTQTKRKA